MEWMPKVLVLCWIICTACWVVVAYSWVKYLQNYRRRRSGKPQGDGE